MVKEAISSGIFKGVEVGRANVVISHLQYADDTIFFGDWSRSNACNLMGILKCFETAPGLRVNLNKSRVYGFGVTSHDLISMENSMGCRVGSTLFMYLGLPIGLSMRNRGDWNPVVTKFKKRLADWKARSMSFGGRLTLEGVLIWCTGGWPIWGPLGGIIKVGKDLDNIGIDFRNSFIKKLGDGSSISFWDDIWCGTGRLRDRFTRLYYLEKFKNVVVKDRGTWCNGSWVWHWDWVRDPRGRAIGEVEALENDVSSITPACANRDQWAWILDDEGIFSVKALSLLVDGKILHLCANHSKTLKNNLIPKKVIVFVWRAIKGRIPVRVELDKRGYCIWRARNNKIFKSSMMNADSIFSEIKLLYNWISRRFKKCTLIWLQWLTDPGGTVI